MTLRTNLLLFAATMAATAACTPKADTANPGDGAGQACTEEAMECPDGSSVSREGPDCEFAACPEEDALDDADDGDAAADDGEAPDEADADADAEDAEG
jgi:hypothetical protein